MHLMVRMPASRTPTWRGESAHGSKHWSFQQSGRQTLHRQIRMCLVSNACTACTTPHDEFLNSHFATLSCASDGWFLKIDATIGGTTRLVPRISMYAQLGAVCRTRAYEVCPHLVAHVARLPGRFALSSKDCCASGHPTPTNSWLNDKRPISCTSTHGRH